MLIVDDEAASRELLKIILEDEGYDVTPVWRYGGRDAIVRLALSADGR